MFYPRISRYCKVINVITVKTIAKLNPKTAINLIQKFKKLAVVVHVLQTTQNLVISSRRFEEGDAEMYQQLQRTCRTIVLFINSFVQRRSHCRCRRGFVNSLMMADTSKALWVPDCEFHPWWQAWPCWLMTMNDQHYNKTSEFTNTINEAFFCRNAFRLWWYVCTTLFVWDSL